MEQMIDLNRISTFLKIIRAGNLTRAAELYRIQKSKLSRDLALLEEELGTQLVYRTTRQFQLTDTGQRFYRGAMAALSQLETVLADASVEAKKIAGSIRLTAPEDLGTYLISPLLKEFSLLYPDIEFDILYTNELVDLVKDHVDIGIRVGRLKDSSLKMRKAGSIQMGVFVSKEFYNRWGQRLKSLDQLVEVPCVTFKGKQKAVQQWKLTSGAKSKIIKVQSVVSANSYSTIKTFVEQGMGAGLFPTFLAESSSSVGHQLVRVFDDWGQAGHRVHVVLPDQKEVLPRHRALADFLYEKLQGAL